MSSDSHVQAAASDSLALLMNKLDEPNEGIPVIRNADSSQPDVADADQEQESSMVSQTHSNKVMSDLFTWCFVHT